MPGDVLDSDVRPRNRLPAVLVAVVVALAGGFLAGRKAGNTEPPAAPAGATPPAGGTPSASGPPDGNSVDCARGSGARLVDRDLTGAVLAGVSMRCANLQRTKLARADLTGADLSGAVLIGTDLSAARLRDAQLVLVRAPMANFAGADLTGANLRDGQFPDADFSRVRWSNTVCVDGTTSDANGGTCEGHL